MQLIGVANVNLNLTKKVFIIFQNLNGYDSHLFMNVINEFDINISVIPNGLEKYMTFPINKNFFESKQFMNSNLEKLVKNLSNNDFKSLLKEFNPEQI